MSIPKILIVIALLSAASCQPESKHLPPDEMEKLLLDVQIAEVYGSMAGRDSLHNTGVRNNDSLVVYYREVLAHHHVTLQDFTQSLEWYRQHPDKLDTVYVHTMDRLAKDDNKMKLK